MKEKQAIGITELVSFGNRAVDVPAKIDTGADSSSVWATNIRVGRDGVLRFSLFGEGSPYYNGKIFKRKDFKVASVKSTNGKAELRYRAHFSIKIAGRRVRAVFNLSDRASHEFKVLIGRRTIQGKFVVDVSRAAVEMPKRVVGWNKKMQDNPYRFHKKYVIKQRKGVEK